MPDNKLVLFFSTLAEPWRDIQSGTMAKMVVEKIVELEKVAKAIIDEAENK